MRSLAWPVIGPFRGGRGPEDEGPNPSWPINLFRGLSVTDSPFFVGRGDFVTPKIGPKMGAGHRETGKFSRGTLKMGERAPARSPMAKNCRFGTGKIYFADTFSTDTASASV